MNSFKDFVKTAPDSFKAVVTFFQRQLYSFKVTVDEVLEVMQEVVKFLFQTSLPVVITSLSTRVPEHSESVVEVADQAGQHKLVVVDEGLHLFSARQCARALKGG